MMGRGSRSAGIGTEGVCVSFEWIGDDAEDYTNEWKHVRGVVHGVNSPLYRCQQKERENLIFLAKRLEIT